MACHVDCMLTPDEYSVIRLMREAYDLGFTSITGDVRDALIEEFGVVNPEDPVEPDDPDVVDMDRVPECRTFEVIDLTADDEDVLPELDDDYFDIIFADQSEQDDDGYSAPVNAYDAPPSLCFADFSVEVDEEDEPGADLEGSPLYIGFDNDAVDAMSNGVGPYVEKQ